MSGQDPDVRRQPQDRIEVEQPVSRAVDFEIELRQLPEIEGVVHRVDLLEEGEERMLEDFGNRFIDK